MRPRARVRRQSDHTLESIGSAAVHRLGLRRDCFRLASLESIMKPIKGLVPLREMNGRRSRIVKPVPSNVGLAPSRRRQKGLIAHTCAIYAIEDLETGYIKIGTSRDVARRLDELQFATPSDLRAFGAFRGFEPTVRRIEELIHRRLKGTAPHVKGEWYRFTPQQAHDTIQAFAKEVGLVLADDHQYPFGDLTARLMPDNLVNDSYVGAAPRVWDTVRAAKGR
jgi:hypothetical protein